MRALQAPISYRRDRTRHRHARLRRAARRYADLLRDRSGYRPHRARSQAVQLRVGVRAERRRSCSATRGCTLADAPDGSYDLIFVDAFIGAAIPIHLLTREAMALYLRKLKPHGIVAMHVSNRNLELASVVAGIAEANGAITRVYDGGDVEEDASEQQWVPRVAAVARRDEDFGALAKSEFWPIRERDPSQRVWTDDYSNIVGSMLRNLRERRRRSGN